MRFYLPTKEQGQQRRQWQSVLLSLRDGRAEQTGGVPNGQCGVANRTRRPTRAPNGRSKDSWVGGASRNGIKATAMCVRKVHACIGPGPVVRPGTAGLGDLPCASPMRRWDAGTARQDNRRGKILRSPTDEVQWTTTGGGPRRQQCCTNLSDYDRQCGSKVLRHCLVSKNFRFSITSNLATYTCSIKYM